MKRIGKVVRKHKYRAEPTVVDGIRFASKKEANRYGELKLMLKAGLISDFERQKRYELTMKVTYVADFVYVENGKQVVEDVKGFRTKEYQRKKKLLREQHGIEVIET